MMDKAITWLKGYGYLLNPYKICQTIENIEGSISKVCEALEEEDRTITLLEDQLREQREETDKYKSILKAVSYSIPDMMWAKDIDGRYIYANIRIRNELFYGMDIEEVIGKTDMEITENIWANHCDKYRHTFGLICGNSDVIVTEKKQTQRFLEWGLVKGENLYLEVNKAPIYNRAKEFVGVCGTGRNVTDYYLGLKQAIDTMTKCHSSSEANCFSQLQQQLDKYKFEG